MPRPPRIEPAGDVVARVASTALVLPDAYEEDAWTGVRWQVRNKTFAHVLVAQEGHVGVPRHDRGDRANHGADLPVVRRRAAGPDPRRAALLPAAMVAHRRRHGARRRHRLG